MKVKGILINLSLALAAIVFILVVIEIGLRLADPNKDVLCVFPPNLHYEFDPDSSIIHGVYGKKNFDTDRMGIRKFDSSNPDEYEILFIGGSTTECLYLHNRETWPYLVAKKLGLKGGSIGKSGQTSYDHYMQMKYFVPQLKKLKTVVVMCGLNDMLRVMAKTDETVNPRMENQAKYINENFTHTAHFPSSKGSIIKQIARNFYRSIYPDTAGQAEQDIDGSVYNTWRNYRAISEKFMDDFEVPPGEDEGYLKGKDVMFEVFISNIIKEAKGRGLNIIFIGQQSAWKDSMSNEDQKRLWLGGVGKYQKESGHSYYTTGFLASQMTHYNEMVKGICLKQKIPFIDISNVPNDIHYLYDDCHFTERGARELADSLYPSFKRLLINKLS